MNAFQKKIADLKPHKTKRKVSVSRVRYLVGVMSTFGQLTPIKINDKDEVVDGWHRLCAAKELGWEFIACVVVSNSADQKPRS